MREPSHAGSAYPMPATPFVSASADRLPASTSREGRLPKALAAPHVSPEGGFASYRAAYDVAAEGKALTFVVLGHVAPRTAPERFGLTRKPFRTPLGSRRRSTREHRDAPRRAPPATP